jgi:glycosyltransferase involved in cell wall biosynthesis
VRIAVLAHSFPRFPGDTHGPFVKRLSEELAELGHEVRVLVPWDPELSGDPGPGSPLAAVHSFRYVKPDRWHRFGYSRTMQRDVKVRGFAVAQAFPYLHFGTRALRRLVREHRIDLVHAHWILPNGWMASRVARSVGVPFISTLHGTDVYIAEKNAVTRRLAASALAAAGHVTSCSADLRSRLLAVAGAPEGSPTAAKVSLVPNGTDLPPDGAIGPEAARAARRALGLGDLPGEARIVAAVGRMVDKKGFRYLLEAAPAILRERPDVRLVIGGQGDLLEEHRARAGASGYGDRILFPGGLQHPQVLELLAAAEVFVMPSVRDAAGNIDGLPVVVLEAMAAGAPVVATALAGMPLAVEDGESGLLVPEKDPEALAGAIGRLLDDPARGRALGEAGRARVEAELTWKSIARIHDGIYRRVAGRMRAEG